jgi:hypothetical protein
LQEMCCIPFLHPYNVRMSLNAPESPEGVWQYAAENLRRHKTSGIYYAFIKRGRKQFRRSLKTNDKALAKRKLADLLRDVDRLASAEGAHATFDEVAARWIETTQHALKAGTIRHRQTCLKAVAPFFRGLSIRNLTPRHCEAWVTQRGITIASQTFVHELQTMRAVFRYAYQQGLILRNPAEGIKRPRIIAKTPAVPTREQFQNIVVVNRFGGSANWSITGIALQGGTNIITVTANDAAGNSGNATLSVKYNLPALGIVRQNSKIVLTWPTNAADFTLENATNLIGTVWTTNSSSSYIVNGQITVTNTVSNGATFYRLLKP